MAPQVSLADDFAALSQVVSELARRLMAGPPVPPERLKKAAAAAGLSVEQARLFMRGEATLAPRQSVVFCGTLLEQARMQQVSYMTTLRKGHAGSNIMGASYQAKMAETVPLSRGRTEDREWVRGGPVETTAADVDATLTRLAKDFAGWKFTVDGEAPGKLVWLARHRDHGEVSGATSFEVAEKLVSIELDQAAKDAEQQRYMDGRGISRRLAGKAR